MFSPALLTSSVLVAGLLIAPAAEAAPAPGQSAAMLHANPADGVLNQGQRTMDFDHGWKFQLVNTADTTDPSSHYGNSDDPLAAAPNFDDSAWRQVTLPHDWSIEQQPSPANSNATGYFPGGLGWYRNTFTLPSSMAGKTLSVDFDGVYMNSYVYLNGQLLGNHPYGYTGFSFDLTGKAHTDGHTPNVLAVVVQSKEPNSRWYSGNGITRNVHLTVTDPVHVARWGVGITTPNLASTIKSGYADVHVQTQVVNPAGTPVTVVSAVRDAAGHNVASGTGADVRLASPHLWSTTDPYLYTLHTEVFTNKRLMDSLDTTFGVRWVTFDAGNGVSLNGKHLKLQGVDLHNDEGALGSADNYDALWRQMSELRSEGVNAFRTSHNPPSPEMLDVCDRLGIVVMDEAFDTWDVGKNPYDYHLYFSQWSDRDIAEMVDEGRDSPAVIMWSIGNEIPDFTSASSIPIEQRLMKDVKAIDPTRPVTANCDQYRTLPAPGSAAETMMLGLDLVGFSYEPATVLDAMHRTYPGKFFFESESSSDTSSRGVYQDPGYINTGENYTPGKRLVSSYDNNLSSWTMSHEYVLKTERDRPYSGGQFVWTGFDYIGEPTPYDQFPVKVSSFGTIDTAGFPKDAYYAFQSQWTSTPMVHLLPMNWSDYKPGQDVEVWAYSNVRNVELFLNGHSLGSKSFDVKTAPDGSRYLETTEPTGDDKNFPSGSYTSPNGSTGKLHLTWHVPFQPGQLVAVARDDNGTVVARDEVDTASTPDTLRITPDKKVLGADGKSLSYLEVDVVDRNGVVVPDADNAVTFSVTGAGTFAGADNGKEDDAEGYTSTTHTAFNGKVLAIVQAGEKPGPITVTASGPGLAPTTTTLYAAPDSARGQIATQPVYLHTEAGHAPALPGTVTSVYADGSTRQVPVRWQPQRLGGPGTYVISGDQPGEQAIVTVDAPASPTVTPLLPSVARNTNLALAGGPGQPSADASYSGGPNEVPAGMLDGTTASGGWSNYYDKSATNVLPAVSLAHPSDWVSVTWPGAQHVGTVVPYFTVDGTHALPSAVTVAYWNGTTWVPVSDQQVRWAGGSNQATTITFAPVSTTALRLDLTSSAPNTATGFLQIAELQVPGD